MFYSTKDICIDYALTQIIAIWATVSKVLIT
jgi:hypothetical protein